MVRSLLILQFVLVLPMDTYVADPLGDAMDKILPAKVTISPIIWLVKKVIHTELAGPLSDLSNHSEYCQVSYEFARSPISPKC